MIRYALKCAANHRFESWFQSASAFDKLNAAGLVACAVCGSTMIEKDLMAPPVAAHRPGNGSAAASVADQSERATAKASATPVAAPLSAPTSETEKALAKLKSHVEAHSEYVGEKFGSEARAIHEGSAPPRAIHGEAPPEEARALVEDGVPILPLPFRSAKRTN